MRFKFCKDCVYYLSRGTGRLGYCQERKVDVSPYEGCGKFKRRRVCGR